MSARPRILATVLLAVVFFIVAHILSGAVVGYLQSHNGVVVWDDHLLLRLGQNFYGPFSVALPKPALLIASVAVGVGLSWLYARTPPDPWILGGYCCIMGGGAENFFERLHSGYVFDYLVVRVGWVVGMWNINDFLILAGLLVWIVKTRWMSRHVD